MCRFLVYQGPALFLEDLVCAPRHSLLRQSLHAAEAKVPTNGDGFGIGWYGSRDEPGIYRELRPAWSDENLLAICRQVRSPLFFAHVRAATGTATMRANCHPFAQGRYLFMHNGQIGGYARIKRKLEAMLPDRYYDARQGTTDSELIFLLALARAEEGAGLPEAIAETLSVTKKLMVAEGITDALRFTAAIADGEKVHAFRAACDDAPPTLYLCERDGATILASEPLDGERDCWRVLPKGSALTLSEGRAQIGELPRTLLAA
jgi:glutamine amidotransferase